MSKVLSKGITLGYSATSSGSYTDVPDLVSIPSLGGDKDKVETTTLANAARQYIPGLVDYGDLEFGFVYDDADKMGSGSSQTTVFEYLKALETAGAEGYWKVQFPNSGLSFTFSGKPSVSLSGAEVGNRIDFTMKIALSSDITVA